MSLWTIIMCAYTFGLSSKSGNGLHTLVSDELSHLSLGALLGFGLLLFGLSDDFHVSTHLHVVVHVEGGLAILINIFIPELKVILLVRVGSDEILQGEGLVNTLAVQPDAVDRLLLDQFAARKLIVVHGVSANLSDSQESQLAAEILDLIGVGIANDIEEGGSVSLTHEQAGLSEDRGGVEGVRSVQDHLDVLHGLQAFELVLDFGFNSAQFVLQLLS